MPFVRRIKRSFVLRVVFILWILATTALFFGNSLPQSSPRSASAQAEVKATVIQALAISKDSDLDFGTLVQGASETSIPAGPQAAVGNATFSVTGEPSRGFTMSLPDDQAVVLSTGGGTLPTQKIRVYRFQSYPPPMSGVINSTGQQKISVGATRASILEDQATGEYRGNFTITVVY